LEVYESNVKAENVAWETSHPSEPVTRVRDGQYPMEQK
jgi:hypothetical protein